MIGITGYGAYIPLGRLGQGTQGWKLPREKTVANWDEDSLTMAVAAAINCLGTTDRRRIDALYCSSCSAPYKEKMMSTLAAWAIDLKPEVVTLDFANSLRCGTSAVRQAIDSVKAGTYSNILVTASDLRPCHPHSGLDNGFGEAAAALVIGEDHPVAVLLASSSTSNEILDIWKPDRSQFVRSWEDRFVYEEGYYKTVRQAVKQFLNKHDLDLNKVSKVALYAPDERRHRETMASLGIKSSQVQDPLFGKMGDTGSSFSLLLLIHALEQAREGDLILSIGYGNGTDISLWQVTPNIKEFHPKHTIDQLLSSKYYIPAIENYLAFREFAVRDPDSGGSSSASVILRERDSIYRLCGVRCRYCGTVQYPPQRVCTRCGTKDEFDSARLADKKGTVFTYTLKNGFDIPFFARPLADTMIDFEGGGRAIFGMTDVNTDEIKIGMRVEMTFRTLGVFGGIHNYCWRCSPERFSKVKNEVR